MILKFTDGKINDSGASVMNAVYELHGYEDISDENIPCDEEGNLFPYYLRTGDVFTRDLGTEQTEEFKKSVLEAEQLVEVHIQAPIDTYNATHGVKFGSVHNCANYINTPTYEHYQFCVDVWAFNVLVWETSRQIQKDIISGAIEQPETPEAFIALLPVWGA